MSSLTTSVVWRSDLWIRPWFNVGFDMLFHYYWCSHLILFSVQFSYRAALLFSVHFFDYYLNAFSFYSFQYSCTSQTQHVVHCESHREFDSLIQRVQQCLLMVILSMWWKHFLCEFMFLYVVLYIHSMIAYHVFCSLGFILIWTTHNCSWINSHIYNRLLSVFIKLLF